MTRIRVVLPQPDGPMKETNSPWRTVRSMSASAKTGWSAAWKISDSRRMSMTVSAASASPTTRRLAFTMAAPRTDRPHPSDMRGMSRCMTDLRASSLDRLGMRGSA